MTDKTAYKNNDQIHEDANICPNLLLNILFPHFILLSIPNDKINVIRAKSMTKPPPVNNCRIDNNMNTKPPNLFWMKNIDQIINNKLIRDVIIPVNK